MLRVLVGENDVESGFDEAAATGATVGFVVPKETRPGDEAVFLFHHSAFVGTGTVLSSPKPGQHGRRSVAFARVGKLKRFPRPLPLTDVSTAIPEWEWTKYPRSFTTPPPGIAAKLLPLLSAASNGSRKSKERLSDARVKPPSPTISSREVTGGRDGEPRSGDVRTTAAGWNELIPAAHRISASRALSRSIQPSL